MYSGCRLQTFIDTILPAHDRRAGSFHVAAPSRYRCNNCHDRPWGGKNDAARRRHRTNPLGVPNFPRTAGSNVGGTAFQKQGGAGGGLERVEAKNFDGGITEPAAYLP
jgi:hypothetical protein